jgi:hypothetical protein
MNPDYLITDPRPSECFKDKTFSGFKKTEVYKTLFKSIDSGKIEDTCFWVTECIVSGYANDLIEKLCIHSAKVIHINNPLLPEFLWRRYLTFRKSTNHISGKEKDKLIHIRNTQSVRNNLMDVAVTLTLSPKTKRYDKLPKVNIQRDFEFSVIQQKMNATMQLLPQGIIRFTDPEELRIIMNEIFFNLKNSNGGYDKVCYWIQWLLQWEKRTKSQKRKFEIETREINGLDPKYGKDMIWLVWEVVFQETNLRDELLKQQIKSLYLLFKYEYTGGKRNARIPYLYQCVGYLTLPLKTNVPIRKNTDIFIQTQCNINPLFKNKKKHEVKEYIAPPKPEKKLKGLEKEIIESRMRDLQDLDLFRI